MDNSHRKPKNKRIIYRICVYAILFGIAALIFTRGDLRYFSQWHLWFDSKNKPWCQLWDNSIKGDATIVSIAVSNDCVFGTYIEKPYFRKLPHGTDTYDGIMRYCFGPILITLKDGRVVLVSGIGLVEFQILGKRYLYAKIL